MHKAIKITAGILAGTYVASVITLSFSDKILVKKFSLQSPYVFDDQIITFDKLSSRFAWDLGVGITLSNVSIAPKSAPKEPSISANEIKIGLNLVPRLWGKSTLTVNVDDLTIVDDKKSKKKPKLFSNAPVSLDKAALLNTIVIKAKQGSWKGMRFENVKIDTDISATNLHTVLDMTFAGGSIHGQIGYKPKGQTMTLSMNGRGIEMSQFKEGFIVKGGTTTFDWATQHSGKTTAELAASTQGTARVRIGSGELKHNWMNLMNLSFDEGVMGIFNTLTQVGQNAKLQCGAATILFKDGQGVLQLANGIATDASTIMAEGNIDLNTENLNLRLIPQSANGGPSKSLIRVQGTIAAPRLGAAPMEIGKAGVKLITGLVTGGMSLIGKDIQTAVEPTEAAPRVNLCEVAKQ